MKNPSSKKFRDVKKSFRVLKAKKPAKVFRLFHPDCHKDLAATQGQPK